MADCLFGILRDESLELRSRTLMLQKGLPGATEDSGEFRPGIRGTHIHNPDCFDPRLRWLNSKEARGLTAFDTTPELPLGCDNQMLVERVSMGGDLDPFAATGDHGEDSASGR